MKKYLIKKIIIGLVATMLVGTTVVGVRSEDLRFYGSNELEQYINDSNAAWEAYGYTTDNGVGNTSSSTPTTQTPASSTTKVKSCEHTYSDEVTKEPTCAESGEMVSTCTKCGNTYKTELSATGKHEYESTVTKEATCTTEGEATYKCVHCADTYTESIKATGHRYSSEVTKNKTCTIDGEMTHTCELCGDTYKEALKATGHTPGDWAVTKEAGIFTTGEKVTKCLNCGEITSTEVIPSKYPVMYLYVIIAIGFVIIVGLITFIILKKKRRI